MIALCGGRQPSGVNKARLVRAAAYKGGSSGGGAGRAGGKLGGGGETLSGDASLATTYAAPALAAAALAAATLAIAAATLATTALAPTAATLGPAFATASIATATLATAINTAGSAYQRSHMHGRSTGCSSRHRLGILSKCTCLVRHIWCAHAVGTTPNTRSINPRNVRLERWNRILRGRIYDDPAPVVLPD